MTWTVPPTFVVRDRDDAGVAARDVHVPLLARRQSYDVLIADLAAFQKEQGWAARAAAGDRGALASCCAPVGTAAPGPPPVRR